MKQYAIRKAYNLNQVDEDDFFVRDNRYYLFGENSQKYVRIFMSVVVDYKQDMFLYIQAYYRAFMQGREIEDYPEYIL